MDKNVPFYLTPEIEIADKSLFVILCNDTEIMGFCENINQARKIIDSLAESEKVRFEKNKSILVFRRDMEKDIVVILTQQLGYLYSGNLMQEVSFSFKEVNKYEINKSRFEYPKTPPQEGY